MYQNRDFAMAYATAKGYKSTGEDVNSIAPMAPWLLMDVALQIYQKNIQPLPVKHEVKRYRNLWKESYNNFNMGLFRAFEDKEGMTDEFIEKMDSMYAQIEHIVIVTLYSCMDCFSFADMEQQKILASVLMSNFLAYMSNSIYKEIYHIHEHKTIQKVGLVRLEHTRQESGNVTPLDDIQLYTKRFAEEYMNATFGKTLAMSLVNEKHLDKLHKASQTLFNQVMLWIIEEDRRNGIEH